MVNIPAAALIFFPLSMLRDMSSLSFASLGAIVALVFTAIVLIVELPFYAKENHNNPEYSEYVTYFDWNFFQSFSITVFAFTC